MGAESMRLIRSGGGAMPENTSQAIRSGSTMFCWCYMMRLEYVIYFVIVQLTAPPLGPYERPAET